MSPSTYDALAALLYAQHKVFVSYHHANDWSYRDDFEGLFTATFDVYISKSVQIGEIPAWLDSDSVRAKIRDDDLCDSTVTVVLVGSQTWQRRHVDFGRSRRVSDRRNEAPVQDFSASSCRRIRATTPAAMTAASCRPGSLTTRAAVSPAFTTGRPMRSMLLNGSMTRSGDAGRLSRTTRIPTLCTTGRATAGNDVVLILGSISVRLSARD